MYKIECKNCSEVNQIHDRMQGKAVNCCICNQVIQQVSSKQTIYEETLETDYAKIKTKKLKKKIIGKKCNKCLELIHKDSKKCKFCGYSSDICDAGMLEQWGIIGFFIFIPFLIIGCIRSICIWEDVGVSILFLIASLIASLCRIIDLRENYGNKYIYEEEEEEEKVEKVEVVLKKCIWKVNWKIILFFGGVIGSSFFIPAKWILVIICIIWLYSCREFLVEEYKRTKFSKFTKFLMWFAGLIIVSPIVILIIALIIALFTL